MTPRRHLVFFGAALILTACVGPSAATTSSTSTTPTTGSTTVIGPNGEDRPLETVACEAAPQEVVIVCEAYDLIRRHYVDEIGVAALASAATEGLAGIEPGDVDQPLVCALPSVEFQRTCETAGAAGLDTPTTAEAMVAAIVANALDPNSAYFTPAALARVEEEDHGEIEGIGALVSAEDETIEGDNKQCSIISETCRIHIVSTIEGAPARAAGLQRDDVIIGVDGEAILGWNIDEVTSRVRGAAGTAVMLTIERSGDTFDLTIVRAAVRIPVLDREQIGETGYIRLYTFSEQADEEFEAAVFDLIAKGARHLVIDLRDNPGGLLDTAIAVTSVFLPDGQVLVTEGPDRRLGYDVTGTSIVPPNVKVDFVVNKGSASASEVVSAVLQERDRVTVLGENTFGKNTVQQRYSLSNGGALKLTIARWLTPAGLDFGGVGVTPDIPLILPNGVEAADVVAAVIAAT